MGQIYYAYNGIQSVRYPNSIEISEDWIKNAQGRYAYEILDMLKNAKQQVPTINNDLSEVIVKKRSDVYKEIPYNSVIDYWKRNFIDKSDPVFDYPPFFFTVVIDKYGNEYAQEIVTQRLFPLVSIKELYNFSYRIKDKKIEVRGEVKKRDNIIDLNYAILKEDITEVSEERINFLYKSHNFSNQIKNGKIKKRDKSYISYINYKASLNVYTIEPSIEENLKKVEIDEITESLNNIILLLYKLSKRNIELYNKYKTKFNQILNSKVDNSREIFDIEKELELVLIIDKPIEELTEFIDELIINHKDHENELTLRMVDKIYSLIYNKYPEDNGINNIVLKYSIIPKIAKLYVLAAYYSHPLDEEYLDSNFINMLPLIAVAISSFEDEGLLEYKIDVDLDNINFDNIKNYIINMLFKEKVIKK